MAQVRNPGYYWLHYTNLNTDFGIRTGLGLAYYGFNQQKQWALWVWETNPGSTSLQMTVEDGDSHIDLVYPQLHPENNPSKTPPTTQGFWWVNPKPDKRLVAEELGWLIAWGPAGMWSGLRQDLKHIADYPHCDIASYGQSVSPP